MSILLLFQSLVHTCTKSLSSRKFFDSRVHRAEPELKPRCDCREEDLRFRGQVLVQVRRLLLSPQKRGFSRFLSTPLLR